LLFPILQKARTASYRRFAAQRAAPFIRSKGQLLIRYNMPMNICKHTDTD